MNNTYKNTNHDVGPYKYIKHECDVPYTTLFFFFFKQTQTFLINGYVHSWNTDIASKDMTLIVSMPDWVKILVCGPYNLTLNGMRKS